MDLGLKGKVVVIIGSSRLPVDLEKIIIEKLIEELTIPVILENSDTSLDIVKRIQFAGNRATYYETDLDDSMSIEIAISIISNNYSGIDFIININNLYEKIGIETLMDESVMSLNLVQGNLISDADGRLNVFNHSKGSVLFIRCGVPIISQENLSLNNHLMLIAEDFKEKKFEDSIRVNQLIISQNFFNEENNFIKEKDKQEAIADICLVLVATNMSNSGKQILCNEDNLHYLNDGFSYLNG
ncbi:hypothetical protein PW52_05155 [Tamlana sedimentorum]|uniref:Uncharacterized protein n=1 Tax=Neotamlana sedimentorum TaxID=1435349 RepID=A0A0D7WBE2_9FLAO|nr:hypothetical protein [Tamlana sedimentorum]KJD36008.1 hypothetical protein PW52_05155 [Tamlana sedimentorum]